MIYRIIQTYYQLGLKDSTHYECHTMFYLLIFSDKALKIEVAYIIGYFNVFVGSDLHFMKIGVDHHHIESVYTSHKCHEMRRKLHTCNNIA